MRGSRGFHVLWTRAASRDLLDIVSWIAEDSATSASKTFRTLQARAESLKRTPARGRLVPELTLIGARRWRETIVGPYRMIYRIERSHVYVLAVLDGRRDLSDLLLERLLR